MRRMTILALLIVSIAPVAMARGACECSHEFPTGRFVREDGGRTFDFFEDGTWRIFYANLPESSPNDVPDVGGRYGVSGNLFTEMSHDYGGYPQLPVTYTWTYDGENLTFELFSTSDALSTRQMCYDGWTYIKVE